jgi:hypothetical protein
MHQKMNDGWIDDLVELPWGKAEKSTIEAVSRRLPGAKQAYATDGEPTPKSLGLPHTQGEGAKSSPVLGRRAGKQTSAGDHVAQADPPSNICSVK